MAVIRSSLLAVLLAVAACSDGASAPMEPVSPCRHQRFEGAGFIVCTPASAAALRLYAAPRGEPAKRRFRELGLSDDKVAFAMNAGMFGTDGRPIGLAIANGKPVRAINLRDGGGNFHLKPNGVFLVRKNGRAEIVESSRYQASGDIALATQSGPMLVIGGSLHPKFEADGESHNLRNGVGIAPGGTPLFVMTADPVSFGKFARFFRDRLHSRDALYFDGSVSSLWDPANGRMDDFTDLGPVIVALK
ncbi:MAG: phosphodiester glycosidase family protein [Sphingomicrobium sp.]